MMYAFKQIKILIFKCSNRLFKYKPELVIVDILAKLKRHNTGHYDAEYQAITEIKELIDKHDR